MNKICFRKVAIYIYLIINGLFCYNFHSQYNLNNIIKINFKILTEKSENVIWTFCRNTNKYYFILGDDFIKKNKINIYIADGYKTNKKTITCPEKILKLVCDFAESITDIAYNEHQKTLSILGFNGLLLIDIFNNQIRFINDSIKHFNYIYPLGKESFLLIRNYNYHDSDVKIKSLLKIINIKNNKAFEREINFKHDIAYTMLLNKFFDVCDNKIVYCRTTEPVFYILDSNLKTIDSSYIKYDNFICNKKIMDKSEYLFTYKNPKEVYFYLKSLDSVNSRIEKVFFNNDSTIILTIKNPGTTLKKRTLLIYNLKTKQIMDTIFWSQHEIYTYSKHFLHFANSPKLEINNFLIYYFSYLPSQSYNGIKMEDLIEKLFSKRKNKYAFVTHKIENVFRN